MLSQSACISEDIIEQALEISVRKKLQQAFQQAKKLYCSEDRKPYSPSLLVGSFGLFSWLRHGKYPQAFETALTQAKTDQQAIEISAQAIARNGSLWSSWQSNNHSFNNYFLTCLRQTCVESYKQIIEKNYGVKFVRGEIDLYRRDSRTPESIFTTGFKLNAQNTYDLRKYVYSQAITYSYGISFSTVKPPKNGNPQYMQGEGYYHIHLPKDHPYLLIDIVNSPSNQTTLSWFDKSLCEVNSMDDIPAVFIKEKLKEDGSLQVGNVNFSADMNEDCYPRKRLGCY